MPGGDQKPKQTQQQQGKGRGGGKKGGNHDGFSLEEQKQEVVPQAIVIADVFYDRFEAVVPTVPALMPLASSVTPLIDNTLYMLKRAGVSEVVVACGKKSFSDVNAHIETIRKWSHEHIRVLNSPQSRNVGDLLRDVFSRNTFGDVISNMDVHKAVDAHIKNTTKDKSCIMTIVFSKTGVHVANRSLEDRTVLGLQPDTNEILLYQWQESAKSMSVPKEMMYHKTHGYRNISIRADLCDPGIFICSPAVLAQLQDDFDFRCLTPDLVKGLLDHCDTLGKKCYAYIENEQYAACVRDLRTYMSVTRDYLGRWVYPLVPDANAMDSTNFSLCRNTVYKEKSVTCGKEVQFVRNVAVGNGSDLKDKVTLTQSVIGRRCKLGPKCSITGSILWDNVEVGGESSITDSLICNNVVIGKCVIIKCGCVIGNGVKIDDFVTIEAFTQIVLPQYQNSADSEEEDDFEMTESDKDDDLDPSKPIMRFSDPSNVAGIVGEHGDGVKLEPSSENPWFNTLVPRYAKDEDKLFLGEDKEEDSKGRQEEASDGYGGRVQQRGETSRSIDDDSDEEDDNEYFLKPVALKKTPPSDEDSGDEGAPKIKGFLDDDEDDDDGDVEKSEPKKAVKGFLDDDDDDEEEEDKGKGEPKKAAKGFLDDDDDDEEEEKDKGEPKKASKGFLDDDDDDDEVVADVVRQKIQSPAPVDSFNTDSKFQNEVAELVATVFSSECPLENFHLQIRTLRMTYNSTDMACGCAILRNLMKVALKGTDKSVLEIKEGIHNIINTWGVKLLKPYVRDNRGILEYVLSLCQERGNPFKQRFFPIILHALFEQDILQEKTILDWEEDMKQSPLSSTTSYFDACKDFLTWLHSDDE